MKVCKNYSWNDRCACNKISVRRDEDPLQLVSICLTVSTLVQLYLQAYFVSWWNLMGPLFTVEMNLSAIVLSLSSSFFNTEDMQNILFAVKRNRAYWVHRKPDFIYRNQSELFTESLSMFAVSGWKAHGSKLLSWLHFVWRQVFFWFHCGIEAESNFQFWNQRTFLVNIFTKYLQLKSFCDNGGNRLVGEAEQKIIQPCRYFLNASNCVTSVLACIDVCFVVMRVTVQQNHSAVCFLDWGSKFSLFLIQKGKICRK